MLDALLFYLFRLTSCSWNILTLENVVSTNTTQEKIRPQSFFFCEVAREDQETFRRQTLTTRSSQRGLRQYVAPHAFSM
jgi:hypothetical protein